MSNAKDIFDTAMTMKEGETLLIPCHNVSQRESLRTGIAWQRRSFSERAYSQFDIICSKVSQNGKLCLALKKVAKVTQGIIVSENGEARPQSFERTPLTDIISEGIDHSRIRRAMEEDGKTQEEIDAYFAGEETSKIDTSLDECNLNPEVLDNE